MAKPEWGHKRTCQSCGARFYDMLRQPIVCPKCEAVFDPLALLRPRRSRAAAVPEPVPEPVAAVAKPDVEEAEVDESLEDGEAASDDEEEEDEDLIEDASELGEDEEDMSEVIDKAGDERDA